MGDEGGDDDDDSSVGSASGCSDSASSVGRFSIVTMVCEPGSAWNGEPVADADAEVEADADAEAERLCPRYRRDDAEADTEAATACAAPNELQSTCDGTIESSGSESIDEPGES